MYLTLYRGTTFRGAQSSAQAFRYKYRLLLVRLCSSPSNSAILVLAFASNDENPTSETRMHQETLNQISAAVTENLLSEAAAENIRLWLTRPLFEEDTKCIVEHVSDQRWSELEQAFWMTIPFGTAGRRGRMYPIGSAAINNRSVGETIQSLAEYLVEFSQAPDSLRCAIAYDCRHRSREFAELSAEIMLAEGFKIYFHDGLRSTPQLATSVVHYQCHCGIMITASHNPPSDNAIKVFWASGGQMNAPHDKNVTSKLAALSAIKTTPFSDAVKDGRVIMCQEETDEVYRQAVLKQSFEGTRDLKIVYSPLHGVGLTSVKPILAMDGFADVEVFGPHAQPDADFPNVPDNIANPENAKVFDAIAEHAVNIGADIAIASDPDADRIGCSAPLTLSDSAWKPVTGNQIGALIGDYILRRRQQAGTLSPDHFVIKTVVTSDMLLHLAKSYGVRGFGEVLTGFKWIGRKVDEEGAENFLFGFEEAHGYLVGNFIRDKDAGSAAMILAQRAAESKAEGRTLHQDLDQLFLDHGAFDELTVAKLMPGADGMQRMAEIMQLLRDQPPAVLAGMQVTKVRDYESGTDRTPGGETQSCDVPQGNLLLFQLSAPGFRAAVRPSGTEPKIKFYLFGHAAADSISDLNETKQFLRDQLLLMHDDFMKAIGFAVEVA